MWTRRWAGWCSSWKATRARSSAAWTGRRPKASASIRSRATWSKARCEENHFMSVIVKIPTPLRRLTQDRDIVQTEGGSLAEAISGLESSFPGLRERLCDEQGQLRRFVNVYINGEDVRVLSGLQTPLKQGDE